MCKYWKFVAQRQYYKGYSSPANASSDEKSEFGMSGLFTKNSAILKGIYAPTLVPKPAIKIALSFPLISL